MAPMFVPGPVDVDPEVAAAQTAAMLPHRSEAFEAVFHKVEGELRKLFFTKYRVFIAASSGTGFQEAAVRNFVPDSGRVLACVNGAFGKRWHDVAVANGKRVDKLDAPWDTAVSPKRVLEALESKPYDLITVVHNETSTGLENPVREIASMVQEISPATLICVDAVSSLSAVKIEMDAWGVDFLLTSSQKAFALPPGLAFAATSDRALARAAEVPRRGWYFDLVRMEDHRVKNSTPATPAIGLIYALEKQLERISDEGLENRFARHKALANRVQDWALDRGLGLHAPEDYRSKTVTAVNKPAELDIASLNEFLLGQEMRVAAGYSPLKESTFRIAHMGELQMMDVVRLLAALDEYLAKIGVL